MPDVKKSRTPKQGVCPACGSEELAIKFADVERFDDKEIVPYSCGTCGFDGFEHYKITFQKHVPATSNQNLPSKTLRTAAKLIDKRIYIPSNDCGVVRGYYSKEQIADLINFLADMLEE